MSGRFRVTFALALTLIIGHGDLAAENGRRFALGITAPATE